MREYVNVKQPDHTFIKEPRLGMKMDFTLNVRYRIIGTSEVVNAMFNDITFDGNTLTARHVYAKYGSMKVSNIVRGILMEYTPEEVTTNYKIVSAKISSALKESFKETPLEILDASLADVTLPPSINAKIIKAKNAKLALVEEVEIQKKLILQENNATAIQVIRLSREVAAASSYAIQNAKLAKGISADVIRIRELQLEEQRLQNTRLQIEANREVMLEASQNSRAVFVPYGDITSSGVSNRMYSEK